MKLSEVLENSWDNYGLYSFFLVNENKEQKNPKIEEGQEVEAVLENLKKLEDSNETTEEIKKWLNIFAYVIAKTEGQQLSSANLPSLDELKKLFLSPSCPCTRLKHLNDRYKNIDYILPEDFLLFFTYFLNPENTPIEDESEENSTVNSDIQEIALHKIFDYLKYKFKIDGLKEIFLDQKRWLEEKLESKAPRYKRSPKQKEQQQNLRLRFSSFLVALSKFNIKLSFVWPTVRAVVTKEFYRAFLSLKSPLNRKDTKQKENQRDSEYSISGKSAEKQEYLEIPSFELSMRYACLEIERHLVNIIRDYNNGVRKEITPKLIKNNIAYPIYNKVKKYNFKTELITQDLPEKNPQPIIHHNNLRHEDNLNKELAISDVRNLLIKLKEKCLSEEINNLCTRGAAVNLKDFLEFAKSEAFCFTAAAYLLHNPMMVSPDNRVYPENWKTMLFLNGKTAEGAFYEFDSDCYTLIADVFKDEKGLFCSCYAPKQPGKQPEPGFCDKPKQLKTNDEKKKVLESTKEALDAFLMNCFVKSELRFSFFIALHSIVLQIAGYLNPEELPEYIKGKPNDEGVLTDIQNILDYSPNFGRDDFPIKKNNNLLSRLNNFRSDLLKTCLDVLTVFLRERISEDYHDRK